MLKREYKISVNNDDWMAPEETLMDASSDHSDLEMPIAGSVFQLFFIAGLAAFLVIFAATFKIAANDHEYYANIAVQNRSVNYLIPPPRGIIYDREGVPLVKNDPSFDLLLVNREFDLKDFKAKGQLNKLSGILNIRSDVLEKNISDGLKSNSIFFLATDLSKDQVLAVKYLEPIGMHIVPDTKRNYIDGAKFSQVIGYVSKVSKDDLEDPYYQTTDTIGRLGIEYQYEKYLRGDHGRIFFGSETALGSNLDPKIGNSIALTIDADLQKKLYAELQAVTASAGLTRAAAIIQNPQNGEVLAMVSLPSFDNNEFTKGLSEESYKRLFENKARPLFNRVIAGLYHPGSTIKPLIGMMALQERIVAPQDTIKDCVQLTVPNTYNNSVTYVFKNWREELGLFNLRKAIANSCNVYFYTIGGGFGKIAGLGIQRISNYLSAVLAGSKLGIDIPGETSGFVPTPDWKEKETGEPWYQGDTYNVSIGQGDLIVTPLWLNSYISAIANGGTMYQPKLVNKILDSRQNIVEDFKTKPIAKIPFRPEVIKEVKSDMEETIISGTAQIFQDLPVRAGAKTGTAEVAKGKTINSLFTIFAPADHPEIAMTVLVEGSATNQGLAIRTAHNVLKWYFGENASISYQQN